MTDWLDPLNLDSEIFVNTGDKSSVGRPLPEWFRYLTWLGWWMHCNSKQDRRIFTAVILPTRICCSAFCSLGSVISAARFQCDTSTGAFMGWKQVSELEHETEIFFHLRDDSSSFGRKNAKGLFKGITKVTLPFDDGGDTECARIDIVSIRRNESNCSLFIPREKIVGYDISLTQHTSDRRERRLEKLGEFYSDLIQDSQTGWVLSGKKDNLVITNKAGWKRQYENLWVSTLDLDEEAQNHPLPDIVLSTDDMDDQHNRSLLLPYRTEIVNSKDIPLAILDGPEAIVSLRDTRCPNVIMLLDTIEYEQTISNTLTQIASQRSDGELPTIERVPDSLPQGVQMEMYAVVMK